MEQPTINTTRCILRPPSIEDAEWMYRLFNDKDVVSYIEGIKWFNVGVDAVMGFIKSMETNFQKQIGILWCIIYNNQPIGIIMVNDFDDNPFLTFALFPEYRNLRIGTEVYRSVNSYVSKLFGAPSVETDNPIVKKIVRHNPEILFINNQYFTSLKSLKDFIVSLDVKKDVIYT